MRSKEEILHSLTEEQQQPTIYYKGLIAVVAGPGSGKTHSLCSRTEYMIADGVPASAILLFTFTRKAAEEMRTRLHNRIGDTANKITICTYHSFCAKLLRKHAALFGWDTNFSIYDEQEKISVLTKIIKEDKTSTIYKKVEPSGVSAYISKCKDKMISPAKAAECADNSWDRSMANYYKLYEQELKKQNAYDFDDLTYFGFKLIKEYPEIAEEISTKYQYITADEAQDSSKRDIDFIFMLGQVHQNICLVGDEAQAIYGFRGADVDYVVNQIAEKDMRIYNLNRNFRSTETIVDASSAVIDNNNSPLQKDLYSKNGKGEKINWWHCVDPWQESVFTVKTIKFLHERKGYSYNDIAVLMRLNSQSRILEELLMKFKIPYRIIGNVSFYNRMEIRDVISYLRIAYNMYDAQAFERSVNVPRRGVGEKTISRIEELLFSSSEKYDTIHTDNLISICETFRNTFNAKTNKGLKEYVETIQYIQKMRDQNIPPAVILKKVIEKIKYEDYLRSINPKDAKTEESIQRIANLQELISVAEHYDTFDEFMQNILVSTDEMSVTEEESNEGYVSIITMHAAKGMEWKAVIIISANETICPHRFAIQDANIPEERRLFYVAMTRAKENLFIFSHRQETKGGVCKYIEPSRFVQEIPNRYVSYKDMTQ